jgi:hypothetical protein
MRQAKMIWCCPDGSAGAVCEVLWARFAVDGVLSRWPLVGEIRIFDQICSSDLADREVFKLVCSNTDISCEQICVGSSAFDSVGASGFLCWMMVGYRATIFPSRHTR